MFATDGKRGVRNCRRVDWQKIVIHALNLLVAIRGLFLGLFFRYICLVYPQPNICLVYPQPNEFFATKNVLTDMTHGP